jgi:hypothetical protein
VLVHDYIKLLERQSNVNARFVMLILSKRTCERVLVRVFVVGTARISAAMVRLEPFADRQVCDTGAALVPFVA